MVRARSTGASSSAPRSNETPSLAADSIRNGIHVRMTFGPRAATGTLVVAALLGIACTPAEPPPEVRTEDVAKVEPPQSQPLSLQPWVWYHNATPALARGLMNVGVSNISYQHVVGAPRRYVAEAKHEGLELRRDDLTTSDDVERTAWSDVVPGLDADSADAVVLAEPRSTDVLVSWRIDAGYVLRRYTQDGELRWATEGADADPLDPSHFTLQLAVGGTNVLVYNRRASGAYLDEVDSETGHSVARAIVDPAVLSSRFQWPPPGGVQGHQLGHSWPARKGSYVVHKQGEALVVDHAGPGGKSLWSTTLDAQGGGWWNSAALLEHHDTVVVVAYQGSSSGAAAYGLNRRDGAKLFDTSPGSIGSIGHSKYRNELALTVDEAGHLLTHGNESGGRYIGVLDVAAGRLLGREVWRN